MQNHVKVYMKHYGYCRDDVILCELCGQAAHAIHHIKFKSYGGSDDIDNLIALCGDCHDEKHGL